MALREALDAFCGQNKAGLVSAHADGADTAAQAMLISAGFIPVDFSILERIHPLKPLPEHRNQNDEADRTDLEITSLDMEE